MKTIKSISPSPRRPSRLVRPLLHFLQNTSLASTLPQARKCRPKRRTTQNIVIDTVRISNAGDRQMNHPWMSYRTYVRIMRESCMCSLTSHRICRISRRKTNKLSHTSGPFSPPHQRSSATSFSREFSLSAVSRSYPFFPQMCESSSASIFSLLCRPKYRSEFCAFSIPGLCVMRRR